MGLVAYRLKLPPTSSVHPVFHVSLLKKALGNIPPVTSSLPPDTPLLQEPELVLDRRLTGKGRRAVHQLLVKWVGCPPELATWEDEYQVRHMLPSTTTCGQVISKGGRKVKDSSISIGAKDGKSASPSPKRKTQPNARYKGPEWVN